jgi:hypothetical protein
MKWFRHDSDARTDAKLEKVLMRYGMEGYGLYWYCLELIAAQVEKHNLTFELEHDAEMIGYRTGINYAKVQEIMTFMVDTGLFEDDRGVITCLKMAKRTDEYTQKLLRDAKLSGHSLDTLPTPSGHNPEKSELREEKRREDIFIAFWNRYPKKVDKKKARAAFNRLTEEKKQKATEDCAIRYSETDKQFIPNPTTYIHGERWEDEVASDRCLAYGAGGI